MSAGARLIHLQTSFVGATYKRTGTEHEWLTGFAVLAIQKDDRFSDAFEFVRVHFRQIPGGRIEGGDVQIEKIELAVWDETKTARDENGQVIDQGLLVRALARDVPAFLDAQFQWLQTQLPKVVHLRSQADPVTESNVVPLCGISAINRNWTELTPEAARATADKALAADAHACPECLAAFERGAG